MCWQGCKLCAVVAAAAADCGDHAAPAPAAVDADENGARLPLHPLPHNRSRAQPLLSSPRLSFAPLQVRDHLHYSPASSCALTLVHPPQDPASSSAAAASAMRCRYQHYAHFLMPGSTAAMSYINRAEQPRSLLSVHQVSCPNSLFLLFAHCRLQGQVVQHVQKFLLALVGLHHVGAVGGTVLEGC